MLSAQGIFFSVHDKNILHDISLRFTPGKFHAIMGQNGSGKSTLLRILAGSEKASSGKVMFNDKLLHHYNERELARQRAVLSQHYHISFPISVHDVVMMGRYPFFKNAPSQKDKDICKQAMQLMQVLDFADRDYNTLSGGEAQKVMMSRVLSQVWECDESNACILFLDEPVSHLDIRFQHQLMQTAKAFCNKHLTVVAVLHDVNLALKYADELLFMKNGRLTYNILPHQLNETILEAVFDMRVKMKQVDETLVVYTP